MHYTDFRAGGRPIWRLEQRAWAERGPRGSPWFWSLAYGHHYDRTPTHGYAVTREAAMADFKKSWQRE